MFAFTYSLREFFKTVTHPQKLEFIQLIDKYSKELSSQMTKMNSNMHQNSEFHSF